MQQTARNAVAYCGRTMKMPGTALTFWTTGPVKGLKAVTFGIDMILSATGKRERTAE